MGAVGQHHHLLKGRHLIGDLFDDRQESEINKQHPVFGMIEDPGDLFGEQPRIDCVIDGTDTQESVPHLHMPPGIPGDRGDAVTDADPGRVEPFGYPQCILPHIAIGRPVYRTLDRPRDNLPAPMIGRRVIDNLVAQKRPVLHSAQHLCPPGNW